MISGICWNGRGIFNKGTLFVLKSILMKHEISFCTILEPKACSKKLLYVANNLGFSCMLDGLSF